MTILWRPDAARIRESQLFAFLRAHARQPDSGSVDYPAAHAWSLEQPETFWSAIWDDCGVVGERGARVTQPAADMRDVRFFPDARLNFAENLLRPGGDGDALIALTEDGRTRRVSWDQLRADTAACRQWLASVGLQAGDRVAAVLPNCPEAVVAMLGASALGATFASASPDFGEAGLLDRFSQIEPRVLFGCDGYDYNGRRFDTREKLQAVARQLPSVEQVVMLRFAGLALADDVLDWDAMLAAGAGAAPSYASLPFDHPLLIVFSSGTTGPPKCIVHRAGGALLQHLKEHRLHADIRAGDRVFYFTTCGWMMWNWLVSALASRATVCLYDGSPFHPDGQRLFDFAARERVNFLGLSAKFIDALVKSGLRPRERADLSALRTIASTGSPLAAEGFDYIYAHVKPDVQLASISGGTDILACFVAGNPCGPVHRGEIQAPALGMSVEVWDDAGRRLRGAPGELVCTRAFPSLPLGFLNDPDGSRYAAAYFERFPGVWSHGDYAVETPSGGYVILGRSDAVLNPGGVRIGTAEIYRQVARVDEVVDAVAVGQDWQGDQRVVLFVVLRDGVALDAGLEDHIRDQIRRGASPRHVPAIIAAVPDVPRTRSNKVSELAVRELIHGRPVRNAEALANPEVLDVFRAWPGATG